MKKLIVAVAALALMAGSAYAAEWNFYGSARVATFYQTVETINNATADTSNISEALHSNSRIGAKVKVSDELSGRFEYGTGVNVRLLYGEWNFGAGKLLVGQDYTPVYTEGPAQVYNTDNGLIGWGLAYGSRKAQLKLIFGDFEIAAVAPSTAFTTTGSNGANTTVGNAQYQALGTTASEIKVPQIQASYKLRGDNWMVKAFGGFQTFEVNTGVGTNAQDVTSYVLGLSGDMTVGQFTFGAQLSGGDNAGNIMSVDVNGQLAAAGGASTNGLAQYTAGTNTVTDNEVFMWCAYVGYAVNDMFALQAGYGSAKAEYDTPGAVSDDSTSYYLQAPITLAPGVMVIPEIGMVDYEETNQQQTTYFGAKWMINF
jgi:hypothetical protein